MSMESVAKLPEIVGDWAFAGVKATGNLHYEYAEKSWLNNFWTYPLHGVVSVLSIAATPLISAVALIAALILIPASFCCKTEQHNCNWYMNEIGANSFASVVLLVILPLSLLWGIVNPEDKRSKRSDRLAFN